VRLATKDIMKRPDIQKSFRPGVMKSLTSDIIKNPKWPRLDHNGRSHPPGHKLTLWVEVEVEAQAALQFSGSATDALQSWWVGHSKSLFVFKRRGALVA
jgi:hypothetical protein